MKVLGNAFISAIIGIDLEQTFIQWIGKEEKDLASNALIPWGILGFGEIKVIFNLFPCINRRIYLFVTEIRDIYLTP